MHPWVITTQATPRGQSPPSPRLVSADTYAPPMGRALKQAVIVTVALEATKVAAQVQQRPQLILQDLERFAHRHLLSIWVRNQSEALFI